MMNSLRNVLSSKLKAPLMSPRLLSGSADKCDSKNNETKGDGTKKKEKPRKKDICGNNILPTGPRCKNKPGVDDKSKDKKPPK